MALTQYTFKRHEELMDDELIQEALESLSKTRIKLANFIEENHPKQSCPVCGRTNIRYEWDRRLCNDCGWHEKIDVPHKGSMSISRKLESLIKQAFGRKLAQAKKADSMKVSELKHVPVDLESFETGEYTDEQVEYLNERFKDILDTPHMKFDKKDIATIHFLVLQELKIKELYRREAIDNSSALDKDFTQIKKNELSLYNDLKDDVKEIIEKKKSSESELSLFDKINKQFDSEGIEELLESFEKERQKRQERIEKSKERRKEILTDGYNIDDEIEEIKGEIDDE